MNEEDKVIHKELNRISKLIYQKSKMVGDASTVVTIENTQSKTNPFDFKIEKVLSEFQDNLETSICVCERELLCKCKSGSPCECDDDQYYESNAIKCDYGSNCRFVVQLEFFHDTLKISPKLKKNLKFFKLTNDTNNTDVSNMTDNVDNERIIFEIVKTQREGEINSFDFVFHSSKDKDKLIYIFPIEEIVIKKHTIDFSFNYMMGEIKS